MAAPSLIRPLDVIEYDPADLDYWLDQDARWRDKSKVLGGPLRTADGQMAAVPAFMRLDMQTDRNGPLPEHHPELGNCWVWTGSLTKGYGYIRVGKRKVQAYLVNYERWIGPRPPGAVLDHLCRRRSCVRPTHLEPVTYSKNATRSPIHSAMAKAARDCCPEGHEFDEANTYIQPGSNSRQCRRCMAIRRRQERGSEERSFATDTHCAQGHEWPQPRGKNCPICNREAGRKFRERQRATQAVAGS